MDAYENQIFCPIFSESNETFDEISACKTGNIKIDRICCNKDNHSSNHTKSKNHFGDRSNQMLLYFQTLYNFPMPC